MNKTGDPVTDAAGRIVVAADVAGLAELRHLLDRLGPQCRLVKVGLELFTACGPAAVEACRLRGLQVFLDLKLCDIPNTVAGAVRAAASLGVRFLTLHASGGRDMMAAAVAAAAECSTPPQLLAVTVLTSLGAAQLAELGLAADPAGQVRRLAELARDAGVTGLVCSAREVAGLRRLLGPGPLLVTPGIRPAGSDAGDQVRTATPAQALAAGADLLVIGRPITAAADPAGALAAIIADLAQ